MKIRYLIIIIMTTFLMPMAVNEVSAASKNVGAQFLMKVGYSFYEQGRLDEAIHEYSKALMLEPRNQEAKAFLGQFGLEKGLYATGTRTSRDKIVKLGEDIKGYKDKVSVLSGQNKAYEAQVNELQKQRDSLFQAKMANELEKELVQEKLTFFKKTLEEYEIDSAKEIEEIEDFYSDKMVEMREALVLKQKMSVIKAEPKKLSEKELDALNNRILTLVERSAGYEEQLAILNKRYLELREHTTNWKQWFEDQHGMMEDYVYIRNHELGKLSDEALRLQVDITRADHLALAKADAAVNIVELEENYMSELHQKEELIHDKDKDIDFLKEKLNSAHEDLLETKSEINKLLKEREALLEDFK